MFNNLLFITDIHISYYKYFILNNLWIYYITNDLTFDEYYKYNNIYMNQIKLYNYLY